MQNSGWSSSQLHCARAYLNLPLPGITSNATQLNAAPGIVNHGQGRPRDGQSLFFYSRAKGARHIILQATSAGLSAVVP